MRMINQSKVNKNNKLELLSNHTIDDTYIKKDQKNIIHNNCSLLNIIIEL